MYAYQDILKEVLEYGVDKQPVRFDDHGVPISLDNGTKGIFAAIFRHQMSNGFPLLTTKKMPLKTIAVELEGFIKGITSKKWYQERRCRIWNEWANPREVNIISNERWSCDDTMSKEEADESYKDIQKQIMLDTDDLGPIYGYQWRTWNMCYDEDDNGCVERYDQFKTVCDRLRENPYDRRMVVSAWNPVQITRMALPPCHFAWNVVVYGNKLNLIWHQRSCDLILGVPFNIASYAMLLLLLATHSGLEPGELVGTLNDCHIYNNQIEQGYIQLSRKPMALPRLELTHDSDIFNWTHKDIKLFEYNPHPSIKAPVTVC